ncbi:MAG: hypothetical protein JW966_02295 [Anaerolineae bacterium]|nr:hypothetical protein [Anaerolineae bacterium]
MDHHISFDQTIACLDATHQPYDVFSLQQDITIVVTQRGGRVLGPFLPDDTGSLFWMNRAWSTPETFRDFLTTGQTDIGGERLWIAPEIQYNVRDRANFNTSYRLPPQIDPGHYTLSRPDAQSVRLQQHMTLQAYNLAAGEKTLDIDVLIRPAADPLRFVTAYQHLRDGVLYAGYEQIVTLSERHHDAIRSASWNLVQVHPGGQMIVPVSPCMDYTDYRRGPLPENARTRDNNAIRIPIGGEHMFKVGYKAAHITGRMAYFNTLDDTRSYLLIKRFTNNPSSIYIEEPADQPGVLGDSVHVFYDGGAFGGFAEMECQGQTIGGASGQSSSTDSFMLWLYVGAPDRLNTITAHLLGVTI